MYAAVRNTATTRNGLLAWLASAACLLCLTACPGNGGAQDSGGTVYTGSGGGSSGSSISADDIRTWSNSDEFGKLIELLSGGSSGGSGGGSAGTTPVDLSTDDWGIPAGGGTVTITMTVDGETTTYSSDIQDGKVHFDLKNVPTGSRVTVKMDVRDGSGTLLLTGTNEKTVSGEEDTVDVRLSDKIDIPVTAGFDYILFACNAYDYNTGTNTYFASNDTSFPAQLGDDVAVAGCFIRSDFSKYPLSSSSQEINPVSEDSTLQLVEDMPGGSPMAYTPDQYVSASCDTSGTYTAGFIESSEPQLYYASNQGLIEVIPTRMDVSTDGSTWAAYSSGSLPSGTRYHVFFKIKIGSLTSGEFCSYNQTIP